MCAIAWASISPTIEHWGQGLRILKLHGSSNWLRCNNASCTHKSVFVSAIQFVPRTDTEDHGYIDRVETNCKECGTALVPFIVPPTWSKNIDDPILALTWTRAAEVLSQSEAFAAVGYSLPTGDSHVKQLLNIGFSTRKLRQAVAIVGRDQEAKQRWEGLFRESWRNSRLEVRQTFFQADTDDAIYPALAIPRNLGGDLRRKLLPIRNQFAAIDAAVPKILEGMKDKGVQHNMGVSGNSWETIGRRIRTGKPFEHDTDHVYAAILEAAGLRWFPSGAILPSHGITVAKP